MEACLKAWQSRAPAEHTPQLAHRALAQLQLFDALSLWFCCDEATTPDDFEAPASPLITLTPQGPAASGQPLRVSISPWPFTVPSLNLEVRGRSVPIRRYESREDLAKGPVQSVHLHWHLSKS